MCSASLHGPAAEQSKRQELLLFFILTLKSRIVFNHVLSLTLYFLDLCKLCFLSALFGGRESVVGPVPQG